MWEWDRRGWRGETHKRGGWGGRWGGCPGPDSKWSLRRVVGPAMFVVAFIGFPFAASLFLYFLYLNSFSLVLCSLWLLLCSFIFYSDRSDTDTLNMQLCMGTLRTGNCFLEHRTHTHKHKNSTKWKMKLKFSIFKSQFRESLKWKPLLFSNLRWEYILNIK